LGYYDLVEKTLTLLTNKTVMTHSPEKAETLNQQFMEVALHSFVSGLKKISQNVGIPSQT